ncbi:hypothetical protein AVEN_241385-1 [Araneus ventricosus]|uniref:Uncharacterized protein n=1 Tax=Araneus ventricosus TaxID=182803 RepID=A0A4Y2I9Q4_ARAVE|nr:hypothetical protein AVEN_241385-1 [Araneus ventricosus]
MTTVAGEVKTGFLIMPLGLLHWWSNRISASQEKVSDVEVRMSACLNSRASVNVGRVSLSVLKRQASRSVGFVRGEPQVVRFMAAKPQESARFVA